MQMAIISSVKFSTIHGVKMYAKRFWIALIVGIVTGIICGWTGYKQTPEDIRMMVFLSALLNRAFIGFAIGISCWKIGWIQHGILLGLIGSLPLSFPLIFNAQAGMMAFVMCSVAGIVWGFIIELFATVIFKAPMK